MTPEARGDAPARPVVETPKWVNPWIISFVLGAAAITLTRSKTRYIPDAPEHLGDVPASVARPDGAPALVAGVRVYGFAPPGEAGAKVRQALESLASQYEKAEAPVTVILLPLGGADPVAPAGVKSLALAAPALAEFVGFLERAALLGAPPAAEPWRYGLLLVDGSGGFRGFYSVEEWGQDEILHRAQHILREEQKR